MAYFEITAKCEEINESSYTVQSTGEVVTKIQLSLVVPSMRARVLCELPLEASPKAEILERWELDESWLVVSADAMRTLAFARSNVRAGEKAVGSLVIFQAVDAREASPEERKLAAARRSQEDGLGQIEGQQTVAQYLASWLDAIKPTIDHGAWKRHEEFVRLHIVPAVGQSRLSALSAHQVQALYANRLASGLSTSTVHHLHASLHKALKDAERLRLVARNASTLVNVPRMAESEIHPLIRWHTLPL
jgi:hypothetical protein